MEEGSASEEGAKIAREIEESLKVKKKTIGPTAPPRDLSFMVFLETIEVYLDESMDLGWVIDIALASALQSKLEAVRSFIEAEDPTKAKLALGEFMDLIENAEASKLTSEGRGLLFYNARYLKEALPDTYIPPVRSLSLAPEEHKKKAVNLLNGLTASQNGTCHKTVTSHNVTETATSS